MKHAHGTQTLPRIAGARIAIIQSKWHRELTDRMVERCRALLLEAGALEPELHLLPGALELPLAAQRLAKRTPCPDIFIAFGVIIKGDTDHYESVRDECMSGLTRVGLDSGIPVIVEVLPVCDRKHAEARSADDEFNKGIEAAVAAIEMVDWMRRYPLPN